MDVILYLGVGIHSYVCGMETRDWNESEMVKFYHTLHLQPCLPGGRIWPRIVRQVFFIEFTVEGIDEKRSYFRDQLVVDPWNEMIEEIASNRNWFNFETFSMPGVVSTDKINLPKVFGRAFFQRQVSKARTRVRAQEIRYRWNRDHVTWPRLHRCTVQ